MSEALFDTLKSSFRGRLLQQEPLSRHTTWRVGGPADIFLVPEDRADLLGLLALLAQERIPWIPLGAGSNLLVRDGGFRGAVIHTGGLRRVEWLPAGRVRAESGRSLMTLIRETARRGLGGLEALAGIPGTIGGGLRMNAGAGGQEMAAVVETVTFAGPEGTETLSAAECGFGYRHSVFPEGRMVLEAALRFAEADRSELQARIELSLAHRRTAQKVGGPNAGSVFKNPPGGQAWRLIAEAGMQGAVEGGARVSEVHANFIVNAGGATAGDILALIDRVRHAVWKDSGVQLETEVKIVGSAREQT